MILFNTNFEYKLENVITNSDGKYLICTIVVNNDSAGKLLWSKF